MGAAIPVGIDSYLPKDVLHWVSMILAKEHLSVPKSWSNDLESIYIQFMQKIKYLSSYSYVNPTLHPLLKAVEAYNWEPVPEGFSSSTIYDFEGITTAEEEYIQVSRHPKGADSLPGAQNWKFPFIKLKHFINHCARTYKNQ